MYNILIVDDEPWAREIVKALGEWTKHHIHVIGEAEDGTQALQMVEDLGPHIVITDMRMPGLDGIGLLKELSERFPALKIIVMSGYDDFVYLKQAIQSKAIEYLLKPLDPNELNAALERCAHELEQARAMASTAWGSTFVFMENAVLDTYLAYRRQIYGALMDLNEKAIVQCLDKLKLYLETALPDQQDENIRNKIGHDFILMLEEFMTESEVSVNDVWSDGHRKNTVTFHWLSLTDAFLDIGSIYKETIEATLALRKNRNRLDLAEVKTYIDSYFQDAISLESIAHHFFVSKEHLSRAFKSYMSENVSDYIVRKRMEKARELIQEQGFAIKHAAQLTGFDNLAYFYKVFKKHFGFTPGGLRKEE